MTLSSGHALGAYRIIDKLGEGGMGEVYRATDTKLGRTVALKLLPESFASDPERLARFEREARTLASLNQPNIAQIYDAGAHVAGASGAYIAMELVEGEDLSQRLLRGPLPLSEALVLARQIVQALDAAHEQGIIHRDLKPANIKVREDGTVKVLDFGLAKATSATTNESNAETMTNLMNSPTTASPAMTSVGVILGTVAYMSPEQAKGKPVDRRADIWAFGSVLYEMLTGRQLFQGETVTEVVAAVLRQDIDLSALPPGTPNAVRRALERCLERDPRKRLRDIGDLRLDEEADVAPVPAATKAAPLWMRLAPWAIAVAGIAGTWVYVSTTEPAFPAPVPTRTTISLPAGMRLPGRNRSIALSPDATTLAVVLEDRATRQSQLYLRALASLEFQPLAGTNGATFPFWSPDGKTIGFFAGEELRRFDLPTGPARTVTAATEGRGADWMDDDSIVFVAARPPDFMNAGLFRVPAEGRGAAQPLGGEDRTHVFHAPSALPGQPGILVSRRSLKGDQRSWVFVDLNSGTTTPVMEFASEVTFAEPGWLVYARDSLLMAQPFDPATRRPMGKAEVLADRFPDDVPRSTGNVTQAGETLVYLQEPPLPMRMLAWYDFEGRQIATIGEPAPYEAVSVSPDGSKAIVMLNGAELWLVDLGTGVRSRFFAGQGRHGADAVWSPDGRRVAFRDLSTGIVAIHSVDGSVPPVSVGKTDIRSAWAPNAWTSDGKFLILNLYEGLLGNDVVVVAADGKGEPRRLAGTPAQELGASLSPDGRWLTYLSNESGTQQAYITAFPNPGERWPVTNSGASLVGWLSLSELYVGDLEQRMSAITVRTGTGAPALGARRRLLGGAPAPGPGSLASRIGRVLFAPKVGHAEELPALVLVNHWKQLLKR